MWKQWLTVLYLLPLALVLLVIAVANVVGRKLGAPGYAGPESDHFDGTHFKNREDVPHEES